MIELAQKFVGLVVWSRRKNKNVTDRAYERPSKSRASLSKSKHSSYSHNVKKEHYTFVSNQRCQTMRIHRLSIDDLG